MARLVVITTQQLGPGFELAGVQTHTAKNTQEAAELTRRALADPDTAVLAVHGPYVEAFDESMRRILEASVQPVVVALPAGEVVESVDLHRARLAERLRRAVGYHISFAPEDA